MLSENEELWEKQLPREVEILLGEGVDNMLVKELKQKLPKERDKTKAVTFRASQGTAVQLFNYKEKVNRIVFGPELIMLEPYEDISVLSLSGGYPVQEGQLKCLCLELGPS